MSETTPEDHLIILREFLAGNESHATSSSIRAQVNCSRVRVNCFRVSVKLRLSCTVAQFDDHIYAHYTKHLQMKGLWPNHRVPSQCYQ